jgi:hypothetical protein
MNMRYFIFGISILGIVSLPTNLYAQGIDYGELCKNANSYGLSQEECKGFPEEQQREVSPKRTYVNHQPKTYKIRLRDAATGNARQWSFFSPGDADREEWVVVTVKGQEFTVRHATNIENKFWGTRQWYDHPATAIRICQADQFEVSDCQTATGDTITIRN